MHNKKILAFACLALASASANAITLTFEEGLSQNLGNGPVAVQPYSSDGMTVSFSGATYVDGSGPSGLIAIAPYQVIFPSGGFSPISANFNFLANQVSIWAMSPLGIITSSLKAFDSNGQLLGSDSYTGLPSDSSGSHPYTVQLIVSAANIRSVVIDGQYWANGATGWNATFDDFSISPVPEPQPSILILAGIGLIFVRQHFSSRRAGRVVASAL